MNSHSFSYEQYCHIVSKNIIIEETTFHNGTKKLKCLNYHNCEKCGGCQNRFVKRRLDEESRIEIPDKA